MIFHIENGKKKKNGINSEKKVLIVLYCLLQMTDQIRRDVVIYDNEVNGIPTQLTATNGIITLKYLERSHHRARTLAYFNINGIKTFLEVDDKDNIRLPEDVDDFFVIYEPEGMEVFVEV